MIRLSVACLVDDDVAKQIRRGKTLNTRAVYALSVIEALRKMYSQVSITSASHGNSRMIEQLGALRPDVVFNLAYSAHPFEASFAGLLDVIGIPYTGSGPLGIALSRDKARARFLMRAAGVKVPQFVQLVPDQMTQIALAPPFIVKPASLASSAGIYAESVVHNRRDVMNLARRIWRTFGVAALCDEFIVGREFRVGMVEKTNGVVTVAGITEWTFGISGGWGFKTEAIRINRNVRRAQSVLRVMASLPRKKVVELAAISRRAMAALDVRGYATVDVRVDDVEQVTVLEVNANPGLWSGGGVWSRPSFESNIRKMVNSALRKRSEWEEF